MELINYLYYSFAFGCNGLYIENRKYEIFGLM